MNYAFNFILKFQRRAGKFKINKFIAHRMFINLNFTENYTNTNLNSQSTTDYDYSTTDSYFTLTESQSKPQIQIQYPPPNTLWWIS